MDLFKLTVQLIVAKLCSYFFCRFLIASWVEGGINVLNSLQVEKQQKYVSPRDSVRKNLICRTGDQDVFPCAPFLPSCSLVQNDRESDWLLLHPCHCQGSTKLPFSYFLHTLYEDDVFILGLLQIKFCSYQVPWLANLRLVIGNISRRGEPHSPYSFKVTQLWRYQLKR